MKDFRGRGLVGRWLGRLQVDRETRAYAWLEGVDGIPRFVGLIDSFALAIEWIEGERLAFAAFPPSEGPRHLAELRSIVDAMHARGVIHNDLRGRENVLIRGDGHIAVIDLAAALRLRPGGLVHRVLFRTFRATDEAAFLKWKGIIAPGTYSPEEEAFLRRFERWRALWPFNPKRRRARSRVARGPGAKPS